MSVKIDITENAKAIVRELQEFPRTMAEAVGRAMDQQNQFTIGHIVSRKLSQRGPTTLGVVTGRLRGSVRASRASVSTSAVESSIGTNVSYAGAHEFGSKPHVIRPRKAKALRFAGPNGVVFARFVNHPGTPARRPIGTGIEERADNYSQAISRAIEEAWGK